MSLAISNRTGGLTSEQGIYSALGSLLSGQVISGFQVRQNPVVGMAVQVGGVSGVRDDAFVRQGKTTYSVFIDDNDAITDIEIEAAHASLPRIDRVVVYMDKSVERTQSVADNTNDVVKIKAVAGVPASSPVAPNDAAIVSSIGASNPYTVLADVRVNSGVTNILNASITDQRDFAKVAAHNVDSATQTIPNTGSAGGTITYGYLGGIKFATLYSASQTYSVNVNRSMTLPDGFFNSILSAQVSSTEQTSEARQYTNIVEALTSAVSFRALSAGTAGSISTKFYVLVLGL